MKSKLLLAMTLLVLSAATHAQSLWGKTTHGMTVDEVLAAHPEASLYEPPKKSADTSDVLRIEGIEIVDTQFNALFFFKDNHLNQVILEPESRLVEDASVVPALRQALTIKYGQPVDQREIVGFLSKARVWTWMSGRTNVNLEQIQIGDSRKSMPTVRYAVQLSKAAENL